MRFDLASPASIFFFFLVPFLAPLIIAQQHQPNVDVTHLDPRASFLWPMSLVKNGVPPGFGRDHQNKDGLGKGSKDPSVLEVKSKLDTRSNDHSQLGHIDEMLSRERKGGQPILELLEARHAAGELTASSRAAAHLSPEAIALCFQEAREALTAAQFTRRLFNDDAEFEKSVAHLKRGPSCCLICGCSNCGCCTNDQKVELGKATDLSPAIEALHRGHATVSSRKATSLSPKSIAFCDQEAQAVTAFDFAAVKSRRFLSDDKETVAMAALYEKRWNCCDNCGCYDCTCCAKERSSELEKGGILVTREEKPSPASPILTREAVAAAHAAAVKSGRFESFKQIISQLGVEERNENCWELCGCGACECC